MSKPVELVTHARERAPPPIASARVSNWIDRAPAAGKAVLDLSAYFKWFKP